MMTPGFYGDFSAGEFGFLPAVSYFCVTRRWVAVQRRHVCGKVVVAHHEVGLSVGTLFGIPLVLVYCRSRWVVNIVLLVLRSTCSLLLGCSGLPLAVLLCFFSGVSQAPVVENNSHAKGEWSARRFWRVGVLLGW